jgi:acetyl esterase/lipase
MTVSDPEIDAIRAILAASPRPRGLTERRERLDGLGRHYGIPADFRLERVDADGVEAEWSTAPAADPTRAILFLHGGGYISGSIDRWRRIR